MNRTQPLDDQSPLKSTTLPMKDSASNLMILKHQGYTSQPITGGKTRYPSHQRAQTIIKKRNIVSYSRGSSQYREILNRTARFNLNEEEQTIYN